MVHQFQHDANSFYRQSKNAFLEDGLGEIDGPCQKKNFQGENSNRSKQTAAMVRKLKTNKTFPCNFHI